MRTLDELKAIYEKNKQDYLAPVLLDAIEQIEGLRNALQNRLDGSPEPNEDEGYTMFKNKDIRALLEEQEDGTE